MNFCISKDGPVMTETGSNSVNPIYALLWPTLTNPFLPSVSTSADAIREACAVIWGDWYIISYPGTTSSTVNDTTKMFHIPSGRWFGFPDVLTTGKPGFNGFSVWGGSGDAFSVATGG